MKASSQIKRPLGVSIYAWLFIFGGFWDVNLLTSNYSWFRSIYHLPDWLFNIRYVCSWFQAVLSIGIGVGFLAGRNLWRKAANVFAVVSLATLYWEYDYSEILEHCRRLDEEIGGMFMAQGLPQLSFVRLSVPALIANYMFDIVFYGVLLYYLNCPFIKDYFREIRKD